MAFNTLQVDPGGLADFTTIQAAIDAAVLAGAGDLDPWTILVNRGTYAEDVAVPTGVNLIGQGWSYVRIVPQTGPVQVDGASYGTQITGLAIQPADDTLLAGLTLATDTAGYRIDLSGVLVQVTHDVDDSVDAVRVTGTDATGFTTAAGCWFEARNAYTGAVTYATVDGQPVASARATAVHVASGARSSLVAMGGTQARTVVGPAGTADPVLVWNEGADAAASVNGALQWAVDGSAAPIQLLNENAAGRGAMLDVSVTTADAEGELRMLNASPDAAWALGSRMLNNLRMYGEIRFHNAPDYPDYRTYVMHHPADELDRIHAMSSYNLMRNPVTGEFYKQVEGKAGFHFAVESEWEDTIEMNFDHTLRNDVLIRRALGMRAHVDTGHTQWTITTDGDNGNGLQLGGVEPSVASWDGNSNAAATRFYVRNRHAGGGAVLGMLNSAGMAGGVQAPALASAGNWGGIPLADSLMIWGVKRTLLGSYTEHPLDFLTNSTHRGGVKADGTWYQVQGGEEHVIPHDAVPWSTLMPMRPGQTYGPVAPTRATAVLTADTCTVSPFAVPRTTALDQMYLDVTTAAADSTIRLGVYADDGTGRPGALVLDAGTIDGATVGTRSLAITLTLPPGLYWLAAAARGGSPSIRTISGLSGAMVPQPAGGTVMRNGYVGTHVADALANPFAYDSTGFSSPYVVVRVDA